MTCSWCEERLERFLDATLSPRDRALMRAHLDCCSGCNALLEEFRVVDALLLGPQAVELAQNFTFATMAEIRAVPAGRRCASPLVAYLVSYLVAAWLLAGAAFWLLPEQMHLARTTALAVARAVLDAGGGLAHVVGRLAHRADPALGPAVAGSALLGDIVLALLLAGIVIALRVRPARRTR